MDKYIYDDKNGLWYELQGDYYIPCLILPTEKEQPIGLWGQRHLHYLKEYHRLTYTNLLTSGRLNEYLAEIDKQAKDMFLRLIKQMSERETATYFSHDTFQIFILFSTIEKNQPPQITPRRLNYYLIYFLRPQRIF